MPMEANGCEHGGLSLHHFLCLCLLNGLDAFLPASFAFETPHDLFTEVSVLVNFRAFHLVSRQSLFGFRVFSDSGRYKDRWCL